MDKKKLKLQLRSLHKMDFQSLLAEMVDEMAECGTQKMAVEFGDEGKPVAGVILLAAPDISRYLEALDTVESGAALTCAPTPPHYPDESTPWDEIAERLVELQNTEAVRGDFITATRGTRAFGNDGMQKGQFAAGLDGKFARPPLEMGFIGYCLGQAMAQVPTTPGGDNGG